MSNQYKKDSKYSNYPNYVEMDDETFKHYLNRGIHVAKWTAPVVGFLFGLETTLKLKPTNLESTSLIDLWLDCLRGIIVGGTCGFLAGLFPHFGAGFGLSSIAFLIKCIYLKKNPIF